MAVDSKKFCYLCKLQEVYNIYFQLCKNRENWNAFRATLKRNKPVCNTE